MAQEKQDRAFSLEDILSEYGTGAAPKKAGFTPASGAKRTPPDTAPPKTENAPPKADAAPPKTDNAPRQKAAPVPAAAPVAVLERPRVPQEEKKAEKPPKKGNTVALPQEEIEQFAAMTAPPKADNADLSESARIGFLMDKINAMEEPSAAAEDIKSAAGIDRSAFREAYKKQRTEIDKTRADAIRAQRAQQNALKKEERDRARRQAQLHRQALLLAEYEKTRTPCDEIFDIQKKLKSYRLWAASCTMRRMISFFVLAALIYLALSAQMLLPLPSFLQFAIYPYYHVFAQAVCLVFLIILSLDRFTTGFIGLFSGRASYLTFISVSAAAALLHSLFILFFPKMGGYLPFNSVCGLFLYLDLHGQTLLTRAKLRSVRSISKHETLYTLLFEPLGYEGTPYFTKCRAHDGNEFLARLGEDSVLPTFTDFHVKILLCAVSLLSFLLCILLQSFHLFFFILAALYAILPAAGLILGVALPYAKISKHFVRSSVAAGSIEGLFRLSQKGSVTLTDDDLFGAEDVALQGYKLFNDCTKEEAVAYTASALTAAGCSAGHLLFEYASEQFIPLLQVKNLEFSEFGGILCEIEGNNVMIGHTSFIYRMGIKPPGGKNIENSVFTVINRHVCAVFALSYSPGEEAKYYFKLLAWGGRKPALETRDFNLSPATICRRFSVRPSSFTYPSLEERLKLSAKTARSHCFDGVLLLRDGIRPYATAIEGARRFAKTVRINFGFGAFSSLSGLILLLYLFMQGALTLINPANYLVFTAISALPMFVFNRWLHKY